MYAMDGKQTLRAEVNGTPKKGDYMLYKPKRTLKRSRELDAGHEGRDRPNGEDEVS